MLVAIKFPYPFIATAVIVTIRFEPIFVGEEDGAVEVCVLQSTESELRSLLTLSTIDDSGNVNEVRS